MDVASAEERDTSSLQNVGYVCVCVCGAFQHVWLSSNGDISSSCQLNMTVVSLTDVTRSIFEANLACGKSTSDGPDIIANNQKSSFQSMNGISTPGNSPFSCNPAHSAGLNLSLNLLCVSLTRYARIGRWWHDIYRGWIDRNSRSNCNSEDPIHTQSPGPLSWKNRCVIHFFLRLWRQWELFMFMSTEVFHTHKKELNQITLGKPVTSRGSHEEQRRYADLSMHSWVRG